MLCKTFLPFLLHTHRSREVLGRGWEGRVSLWTPQHNTTYPQGSTESSLRTAGLRNLSVQTQVCQILQYLLLPKSTVRKFSIQQIVYRSIYEEPKLSEDYNQATIKHWSICSKTRFNFTTRFHIFDTLYIRLNYKNSIKGEIFSGLSNV